METAAKRFTRLLIKKGVIYPNDQELYSYCFELLLSTIVNFVFLLIIAIVTKTALETACFLLGFLSLRLVAGGYHAGTHLRCFLLLASIYGFFLTAVKLLPLYSYRWILLFGSIFTLSVVFSIAPVGHENKPVSEFEMGRYELWSKIITCLLLLAVAVALLLNQSWLNSVYLCSLVMGMCAISISLVMAKIQAFRKERSARNEKVDA